MDDLEVGLQVSGSLSSSCPEITGWETECETASTEVEDLLNANVLTQEGRNEVCDEASKKKKSPLV